MALAFGTMIGWGWIMLSGSWAAEAGMLGAVIAYAFGAVVVFYLVFAVCATYQYRNITPEDREKLLLERE